MQLPVAYLFLQRGGEKQIHLSIGLRITGLALGIIAAVIGILILFNLPGLSQFGTTTGWIAISIGVFLVLLSASIKCVQQRSLEDKKIADHEYLFLARRNGRSQEGCRGSASVERANVVRQQLQEKAPPGISFDPSIYQQCPSIIGTCTAMSLEFASTYLRLRSELNNLDPGSEQFLEKIRLAGESFETSSEEMRSRQIAFSSITIDRKVNMDVSKNKVTSWIRYHNFETDHCTRELDITENIDLLQQEIDSLPHGIYFVRMHKPGDNHKLEARGHSMIYVCEESVRFFYDNNRGLKKMSNSTLLSEELLNVHNEWDIPIVRLYRLKPDCSTSN